MEPKKKYLSVEVTGDSQSLWESLRIKLVLTIDKFLDSIIDHNEQTTIREEAKKFTSALLDHAKQKLKKTGIENEKMIAEIDKLYASKEREIAETRKTNAEAEAIEIQSNIKKLKLSLGLAKAVILGDPGNENILFANQIDAFLEVLNDVGKDQKHLGN